MNIDLTQLRTVEVKLQERIDAARARRDYLLCEFDTKLFKNAIYWESLPQVEKYALIAYRQALLDITIQSGFPDSIVWPEVS